MHQVSVSSVAKCQFRAGFAKRVSQLCRPLVTEAQTQSGLSAGAAHAVGHDAPRAGQQPRQRVLGHVVQAPPRDDEHVAGHVVDLAGGYPARRIRPHGGGVGQEQSLQQLPPPFGSRSCLALVRHASQDHTTGHPPLWRIARPREPDPP
jgi:hypothetical protein